MSNEIQKRLQDLLAYPQESLEIEVKGWLNISLEEDKANLAHAMLALANHGGGFVIIGLAEQNGVWQPATPRPSGLSLYTQDRVNGIISSYAEPPFHCMVHHVPHPSNGDIFPIIEVPGGHKTPIRAKKDGPNFKHVRINTYYIRRPGPSSEPPQSGMEWDELINRCVRSAKDELLESIRVILTGGIQKPNEIEDNTKDSFNNWIKYSRERWEILKKEVLPDETPSRFSHGIWTVSYFILGNIKKTVLKDLLEILSKVAGRETGWPPWWVPTRKEIAPYIYDNNIECWLAEKGVLKEPAHSDFWLASPQDKMFLLRGYQEDSNPDQIEPGKIFDLTLPVWRVGECLLHAERLANTIAEGQASIMFEVTWEGLFNRVLKTWANQRRVLVEERYSKQNAVTSTTIIPADSISSNLPEIVRELTTPLYESFEFFNPPFSMIQEELAEMRSRR